MKIAASFLIGSKDKNKILSSKKGDIIDYMI